MHMGGEVIDIFVYVWQGFYMLSPKMSNGIGLITFPIRQLWHNAMDTNGHVKGGLCTFTLLPDWAI